MQLKSAVKKGDKNKIYFLVAIIIALLGLNGYLYFKADKNSNKAVATHVQQDSLQVEIQKIESELDRSSASNSLLNRYLLNEQQLAKNKIEELKNLLWHGKITQGDLNEVNRQVGVLREFVKNYNEQVGVLEKTNAYLKSERESLKSAVNIYNSKTSELKAENKSLNEKIKIGAALKASDMQVEALRVKDNGKSYATRRASSANKLRVNFAVVPNALAPKSTHKVYLRVFDPAGNLIANDDNVFIANGQKMQYSHVMALAYQNDDTVYEIDWVNPQVFIEGVYTVMLYANGFVMGKSAIALH